MPGGGRSGPLGMQLTPWVLRIMIATAVLSIIGALSASWLGSKIPEAFLLSPLAVWGGGAFLPGVPALWQLFTYPFFILGSPLALLFSILVYGWFAGALEAWWSSRRFLLFFGILTVGTGVLTTLLAALWPALAQSVVGGPSPVLGGLVIAWGLIFRDRQILLFFVLPVKGIHLVAISVGLLVLGIIYAGTFVPFMPQIFGMALGAIIVQGAWRPRRLVLLFRKKQIEWAIARERRARKERVEAASHLRVAQDDESGPKADGDGPQPGKTSDGEWLN